MDYKLAIETKPNAVIMALSTLKHAIEFTSDGHKRQYVNRKHIINVSNKLRGILTEAGIVPNNERGANRIDDPHWYIDNLQLLAVSLKGPSGIKHLVDTIVIIDALLRKIDALESVNMKGLEDAIDQYKETTDSSSLFSIEENKEMLEMLLTNPKLMRRRAATIVLIRTYLELFLRKKGYTFDNLYDACNTYGLNNPQYKNSIHTIRRKGNDAAHGDWLHMSQYDKELELGQIINAINTFVPFKEFLSEEASKLA